MEKKHYLMGDNEVTPEQRKEAGQARNEAVDSSRTLLEKKDEERQQEIASIDVNKIIENFPWRPHQDRVVILPDPADFVLPSGIFIPDSAQEKPQSGVIIALGSETSTQEAILAHLVAIRIHLGVSVDFDAPKYVTESQPGDRVLYGKFAGLEIEIDKVKYLVMRFADIMATLR